MKKTVFLFPGQGSQYVGMAQGFYEDYPVVRELFERASDHLKMDLKGLCFDGPEDVLKQTRNVQPAVTLVNVACLEVLKSKGAAPAAAAGHSLGEYTALYAAGVLGFEDLMELVALRGSFMQEAADKHPGGMLAIMGLTPEAVGDICKEAHGSVEVANHNSPTQTILTGESDGIKEAAKIAKEKKAKLIIPLKVSGPWHSVFMEEARERMAGVLEGCELKPAAIGVIANATAEYVRDPEDIKKNLIAQITSPVLWSSSMERFISDGHTNFVEVGPKKTLKGLMRDINRGVKTLNVEDPATLDAYLSASEA